MRGEPACVALLQVGKLPVVTDYFFATFLSAAPTIEREDWFCVAHRIVEGDRLAGFDIAHRDQCRVVGETTIWLATVIDVVDGEKRFVCNQKCVLVDLQQLAAFAV